MGWLSLLPWSSIARVAGVVAVSAVLAWILFTVKGWHDDAQALPVAEQARAVAIAETARVRRDIDAEVTRLQAINKGLSDENQTLRDQRAATPTRVVRLCNTASPAVPAVADHPAATPGSDAAPPATGPLPPAGRQDSSGGPDIGPALYSLFDEGDDLLRRYRAAQEYIAGLPKQCAVTP